MKGEWKVPSEPQDQQTQLLYLFTGLVNEQNITTTEYILQPVLQWGVSPAGGGDYWAIASWFVATHGVHSKLIEVSEGNLIVGNMQLEDENGYWVCNTTDSNTKQTSSLAVSWNDVISSAYVTLEVYGVTECKNLPKQSVTFTNLSMGDSTGSVLPQWTGISQDLCKEGVKVNSPSSVTLNF